MTTAIHGPGIRAAHSTDLRVVAPIRWGVSSRRCGSSIAVPPGSVLSRYALRTDSFCLTRRQTRSIHAPVCSTYARWAIDRAGGRSVRRQHGRALRVDVPDLLEHLLDEIGASPSEGSSRSRTPRFGHEGAHRQQSAARRQTASRQLVGCVRAGVETAHDPVDVRADRRLVAVEGTHLQVLRTRSSGRRCGGPRGHGDAQADELVRARLGDVLPRR